MPSVRDIDVQILLVDLASIALERRRFIVLVPTMLFLAVVGMGLISERTYSVRTRFAPQGAEVAPGGQLAGLAAQFGVTVPSGNVSESLDFYASLVESEPLMRGLIQPAFMFTFHGDTIRGSLIDIYEIEEATTARAVEVAVRRLRSDLNVSTDPKAGLITLRITSRYPELSAQIAERALELVNRFNLQTRQTQARQERAFVEGRLEEVESELQLAEDSLKAFLEKNRQFRGSPDLLFDHDRLERRVVMRQQVFTSLMQAYEQARIDEVRNTPVITMFEEPQVPALPDSRHLLARGLIAIFLGSVIAIFLAIGLEVFHRSRLDAPEQAERLRHLQEEVLQDISLPWRMFRSRWPTGGPRV